MADCPSEATLYHVLLETRESQTYSEVEAHVEGCASCRERLERIRVNDSELTGGELPSAADLPEIRGFEMVRYLNRGGMGAVYLARQKKTGRLVALKILRSGPDAGSRERDRWLREARAFAMVRHENIVTLYDYGESDSWLYLVLEYIPGGNVQRTLDVPYAAGDAARLVRSIADAVSTIHAAGLLHLDLKPSNIFLDGPEGRPRELAKPRLGDFGIARRWDGDGVSLATESLGGPLGSPSHMAPEQIIADRSKLAPTADIYGLGAVLYHLLTGRAPFSTPSIIETLDQVRNTEPIPPRRLNPKIPRDLETICLKCLEKEPGRRYQTSGTMAEDLDRYLDGRPVHARPISIATHAHRWVRRQPAVSLLAFLLALTLTTGFVGMFVLWRRAEAAKQLAESESARAVLEKERSESERLRVVETEQNLARFYAAMNQYINNILSAFDDQKPSRLLEAFEFIHSNLDRLQGDEKIIEHHVDVLGRTAIHVSRSLRGSKDSSQAIPVLTKAEQLLDKYSRFHPESNQLVDSYSWVLEELTDTRIQQGDIKQALDSWLRSVRVTLKMKNSERKDSRLAHLATAISNFPDHRWNGPRREMAERAIATIKDAYRDYKNSYIITTNFNIKIEKYRAIVLNEQWGHMDSTVKILAERFPIAGQLGPPKERESAWTKSFLDSLREQCTTAGLPPEIQPDLCWRLQGTYSISLTKLRREGRFGDAERAAERQLAIAMEMANRYPGSHVAWWLLDEAYIQLAKNARKRNDEATVRHWTRQALDATVHALQLAPDDPQAQFQVENRRMRLAGLGQP